MRKASLKTIASEKELTQRKEFYNLFSASPIYENEILSNIGIYEKRQELTKKLFFYEIYKRIINIHGVIMEFGTRWGQNLVTLNNLRGILEPYNYSRKIIGFDTFQGFTGINKKDGSHEVIKKGSFNVSEEYEKYLTKVLSYHESEAPLSHINKNILIKGDATIELDKYLTAHPETIIAFAYFDFDIYEPTLNCLTLIKKHITKGTILGFDEILDSHFPGETIALKEALGIQNYSLQRFQFCGIQSYLIIE
jgi:hypothetical protein